MAHRRAHALSRRQVWRSKSLSPILEQFESRTLLSNTVAQFPLRNEGGAQLAIAADTSSGNLWYTQASNNIAFYNPSNGTQGAYQIPTYNSGASGIAIAPDGKVWFAETTANQIGVFDPVSSSFSEYPLLSTAAAGITSLAFDQAGNLWFTEFNNSANAIGEMNTTTHAVTEFPLPTLGANPYGIVYNPVDGNIWFTEQSTNQIGKLNPTTDQITEIQFGTGTNSAKGITVDASGNLWFAESASSKIGKYTLSTSTFTTISGASANTAPTNVAVGPDSNIWFAEVGGSGVGQIGVVNVATNKITEYNPNNNGSGVTAVASLGNKLWYTSPRGLISIIASSHTVGSATTTATALVDGIPIISDSSGKLYYGGNAGSVSTGNEIGVFDSATQISKQYPLTGGVSYDQVQALALNPNSGIVYATVQPVYFQGAEKLFKLDTTTGTTALVGTFPGRTSSFGMVYNASNGGFVWFTEYDADKIGYLNPGSGAISDNFTLATGSHPYGMTVDPTTGDLWFADSGTGKVGIFDPSANSFSTVSLTSATSNPQGIVYNPTDKMIYVAERTAGKIAVINPATQTLLREVTAANTGSISVGPDTNIWFSQASAVGMMDRSSFAVTSTPVTGETPTALAAGSDGNLWFTSTKGSNTTNNMSAVVLNPLSLATKLAITTAPPTNVIAGRGFGLVVSLENSLGNVTDFADGSTVTLTLTTNPGGSSPTSWTATVVRGQADFSGLKISAAGTGYKFTATLSGLTSTVSSAVNATLGATHVAINTQPPGNVSLLTGFGFAVSALDANNNIDASFNGPVSLSFASNPVSATLGGTTTVNAVDGIAVFTGLTLDKLGSNFSLTASTYSLPLALGSLKSVTTSAFNVIPPPASKLVITTAPPTSVTDGQTFGLTVKAEDLLGNVVTTYSGSALVTVSGGSNLFGTQTVTFINGVATFAGLYLDKVGTSDTLTISSGTLTNAVSAAINVTQAPASKLVIMAQPGAGPYTAGGALPSIVVQAEDPLNNPVNTFSGNAKIVISNNPASGKLSGTTTVAFQFGVATFTGLYLDKVGTGYTLQISSGTLTPQTTDPIDIVKGANTQIIVTSNPAPSPVVAAQAFSLTAQAADAYGNVDPSFAGTITAALLNNPGSSTLGGTLGVGTSGGLATFTDLTLNKSGSAYTIQVSSPGLASGTTIPFNVIAAPATQLVFSTQPPSSVLTLAPFGLTVQAVDGNGNVDFKYAGSITVALQANPGSATLGGTKTITIPTGTGTANFAGLNISVPASGYTLSATSGILSSVPSNSINVTPTASKLVFTASPPAGIVAGQTFVVTVAAQDSGGNTVTGYNGTVTLTIGTNPGSSTLSGSTTIALVNGVATFSGLSLNKAGTGYKLTASSGTLTVGSTPAFNIAGLSISGVIFNDTQATGLLVTNGKDPGLAGRVVYIDANNNGMLDSGETSTTTDSTGHYAFNNLSLGTRVIRATTYPGDLTFGPSTNGAMSVTLTTGQPNATANIGIQPTSLLAPFSPNAAPFGAHNPDVETAEVKAVYQLVLGRATDPAGQAAAVAALKNGSLTAQTLASSLLLSTEYFIHVVQSFYISFLGRVGAAADVSAGAALLKGGMSTVDLASFYLTCPEFNARHADNTNFVQTEYHDILGREATPAELSAQTSAIASGTPRATIVSTLINNSESTQRAVSGFYTAVLARPGDAPGIAANVANIQAGRTTLINVSLSFFGFLEFKLVAQQSVG